jgi:hypothetical protein
MNDVLVSVIAATAIGGWWVAVTDGDKELYRWHARTREQLRSLVEHVVRAQQVAVAHATRR